MKNWYKENVSLLWLLAICFIVFDIVLLLTHLLADKPNEFGDSAGAVNGLFSALAFAGVIYAIFLQKRDIHRQDTIQNRQQFENSLFNLLNIHHEIINNISFNDIFHYELGVKKETVSGKDVFKNMYQYANLNDRGEYVAVGMKMILEIESVEAYSTVAEIEVFDDYFLHLSYLIKFIDESPLLSDSNEERSQYISMVRAQLSKYELIWLFYNYISDDHNFKRLIEKYALLKNIRFDLLAKPEHKALYNNSAYEKTPLQEN